jgi:hypothetical protein
MNYLKTYKIFEKDLGYIEQPVEIRFDIQSTLHMFKDSKWRHGFNNRITDDEVIEIVQDSTEQLTIDLMSNKLDVEERFVLRKGDLHLVCIITPGDYNFTLIVITAMRRNDFRLLNNQYVYDVDSKEQFYA